MLENSDFIEETVSKARKELKTSPPSSRDEEEPSERGRSFAGGSVDHEENERYEEAKKELSECSDQFRRAIKPGDKRD